MNITYKKMPEYFKGKLDFDGNSVSAYTENQTYFVKSYDTIMAVVKPNGEVILNGNNYSRTTTKVQAILQGCFPVATVILGNCEYWSKDFYQYDPGDWKRR